MRAWKRWALTGLVTACTLPSCVATATVDPAPGSASPQLLVRADFPPALSKSPVGWIYALDDVYGRSNRCVSIWSDSTWSLAGEAQAGDFATLLARSCVGTEGEGHLRPALDFPANALDGFTRVYVAGAIVEAVYKGRALPRDGAPR